MELRWLHLTCRYVPLSSVYFFFIFLLTGPPIFLFSLFNIFLYENFYYCFLYLHFCCFISSEVSGRDGIVNLKVANKIL